MLRRTELLVLTGWCRRTGMCWTPGRSDDGAPALLVERRTASTAGPMLLVLRQQEFCLVDEMGQTLASSSDLPALLDALDGGIADPVRPVLLQGPAISPYARAA